MDMAKMMCLDPLDGPFHWPLVGVVRGWDWG